MSGMAHFFMSVGGSKFHERLAHFFIDIYIKKFIDIYILCATRFDAYCGRSENFV